MAHRVDWSPAALEDVEAIAEYIARDSSSYAASVVTRIVEATRKLEQFPFAGRIVPEVGQETVREVFAYSYRIMYRIEADGVTVATVVHGKQQFETDRLAPEYGRAQQVDERRRRAGHLFVRSAGAARRPFARYPERWAATLREQFVSPESNPKRLTLSRAFIDAVDAAFDFLVRDFEFRLVLTEELGPFAAHVRYEAGQRAVDLWHDMRCEIDVYVGCGSEGRFTLANILQFVGAPDQARYGGIYSSDQTPVSEVVTRFAEGVHRYAVPWLEGDAAAYTKLAAFTSVASGLYTQSYTKEARPGQQWRPIKRAWQAKDYSRLMSLLEKLPPPLTQWEVVAINYAREQVHGEFPAAQPSNAGDDPAP